MMHKNNFKTLGLLGLFCCSFSYGNPINEKIERLEAAFDKLNPEEQKLIGDCLKARNNTPTELKGFKDAFLYGTYNAVSQGTTKLVIEGASTLAKGAWESLSRIKKNSEEGSPLPTLEAAKINNSIYNALKNYFSYSPKDENKQVRAAQLHVSEENVLLDQEENDIEQFAEYTDQELFTLKKTSRKKAYVAAPHTWISYQDPMISKIAKGILIISAAQEGFIEKIEARESLSSTSKIFYSAIDSSKIKKEECDIIETLDDIKYNLIKLLQVVLTAKSSKDLIARADDTKNFFNLASEDLEFYARLQGPSEFAKLQAAGLRFSRPGSSNEQISNLLAEQARNS